MCHNSSSISPYYKKDHQLLTNQSKSNPHHYSITPRCLLHSLPHHLMVTTSLPGKGTLNLPKNKRILFCLPLQSSPESGRSILPALSLWWLFLILLLQSFSWGEGSQPRKQRTSMPAFHIRVSDFQSWLCFSSDFSFLLICTVRGNNECSGDLVSATHMGNPDWVLES